MSDFIDRMFSEQGRSKPMLSKIGVPDYLKMEADGIEVCNIPKQLINFNFKATWRMRATGTVNEYDTLHKIAIAALTRSVYAGFYQKLTNLELALYDHDVAEAKKIIEDIKVEVGI